MDLHMTGWGRIVVLSAGVGAGHDAAAGELARRLRQRGFQVDIHDFLGLLPGGTGGAASRAYAQALRWTPWWYGALFGIGCRLPRAGQATARLLAPAGRRLSGLIADDVCAVVSVYPLASQVLGALRRRGLMNVPAITYVTDLGVHPMWLAEGIDLHCVLHAKVAASARRLGAAHVRVTAPALAPAFHPVDRDRDRDRDGGRGRDTGRAAGIARHPVALVVGGSWGVGRLERTVDDLLQTGLVTPIVVCGHNARLRERLSRRLPEGAVRGWVTDMPRLMRAVDVLVDNAGGQTTLQAMASGVPVLSYRPLPGHGRVNTAAMDAIGVARWVRHRRDLAGSLTEALYGVPGKRQCQAGLSIMDGLEPAQAIAELASRATAVSLA
jgi:processive 1,2-diacylglycerol beta-glucosyltransferase